MLTGKRAFEGDDISDTLATVLKGEQDWSALPADLGKLLSTLLSSCLTKDRWERLADIAGALLVLKNEAALSSIHTEARVHAAASLRQRLWRSVWPAVAATVIVGLIAGGFGWRLRPDTPDRGVTRFGITLPNGEIFTAPGRHLVAIAPDGSRFVYVASGRLNLRNLRSARGDAHPWHGRCGPDVCSWSVLFARREVCPARVRSTGSRNSGGASPADSRPFPIVGSCL